MKRLCFVAALMASVALHADGADKRLATVRKGYVVAMGQSADDRAVASCLSSHLANLTPIQAVATQQEADVILRVSGDLDRGTPRGRISAELPNGTKLWDEDSKDPLGRHYGQPKTKEDFELGVGCALADVLGHHLNDAMMKAGAAK